MVTAPPVGSAHEFREVLSGGGVVSVFQPIVDLATRETVAFEALARGPEGPWNRPDVLFSVGRDLGLLSELDRACRESAVRAAIGHGILQGSTLFVNVEPEVIDSAALADLAVWTTSVAAEGVRVVLEVTERAVAHRPAELLRTVELVREMGWGIALDDVGVESASLAFMSILEPDVVKLDMSLVQGGRVRAAVEVMHSVNAYAERAGALVLAEGIETPEHLQNALALGASLGQGWLFGRPSTAPEVAASSGPPVLDATRRRHRPHATSSPFASLPEGAALRRSEKRLLVEMSKHLEARAALVGETCVVLSTFQFEHQFTAQTQRRYQDLAQRVGFVCALGEGMGPEPAPGVRGAPLAPDDEVRDEWDLVVLSPHFSVALLARDRGDQGSDLDRSFDYAITYDRGAVIDAARCLLLRVPDLAGAREG